MSYTKLYKSLFLNTGNLTLKDNSTNTVNITAPASVGTSYTLKLPETVGAANQFIANSSTPGVLTWVNGGSVGSSFYDNTFEIMNASTNTKKIMFSAASVSSSTTRTITMPDVDVTLPNQNTSTTSNVSFLSNAVGDGTNKLPSYSFTNDTDTGIYRIGSNNIGISTGEGKRIDISNTALGMSTGLITTFNDTTDATSTSDGSIIVKGGIGVAGTVCPKTLKMTNSVTSIDNDGTLTANSDSNLITQKAVKTYTDTKVGDLCVALQNPTGFPVSPTTILSFNNTSRQFTIAPNGASYYYYMLGTKVIKSTSDNIVISNVTGLHYIYYDTDFVLKETMDFPGDNLLYKVMISSIYWNATTSYSVIVGDEQHGASMSPATHQNLHFGEGTVYISGGSPAGFTVNGTGSTDAEAQFTMSACTVMDEDLIHTLNAKLLTGTMRVIYLSGNAWQFASASSGAYYSDGTRLNYNLNTGGTYSLATVTNNRYVLGHIFASNDKDKGWYAVLGQAQYSTLNAAKQGATDELAGLNLVGIPTAECIFIATVIYQSNSAYTNTIKGRIVEYAAGVPFVDWRQQKINSSSGLVSNHGNLSGLTNDDHLQYYKVDGRTADILKVSNTTDASNSTSGALICSGGVGIAKKLYTGDTITTAGSIYVSNGTVTTPSITFTDDTNTGLYRDAENSLGFSCNGTSFGKLNATYGNVLFGLSAGSTLTTGTNNVCIGTNSNTTSATVAYGIALGSGVVAGSNEILIGQTTNYNTATINVLNSITLNAPKINTGTSNIYCIKGTATALKDCVTITMTSLKDTLMYEITAISVNSNNTDESLYTMEVFKSIRELRKRTINIDENINIDIHKNTNWGISNSSGTYKIQLAAPSSGYTKYYNIKIEILNCITASTEPSITLL